VADQREADLDVSGADADWLCAEVVRLRARLDRAHALHHNDSGAQLVEVTHDGFALTLAITLDSGRPEVEQLTITRTPDGPPVTSAALRRLPLARAVRSVLPGLLGISPELAAQLRQAGPVPDTLTWVAEIYRSALLIGDPPTKTVREVLGISQSTAGNWIGRARSAGLLPPATTARQATPGGAGAEAAP
jgi:hypothetical protein